MSDLGAEVADAGRDAVALVRAMIAGDDEGGDAILDGASLRGVALVLAGMAAECLQALARMTGKDLDAYLLSLLQDSGTPRQP